MSGTIGHVIIQLLAMHFLLVIDEPVQCIIGLLLEAIPLQVKLPTVVDGSDYQEKVIPLNPN